VAAYTARTGLPPASLEQLVWAGALPAIPPDPFGGHYRWDAEAREVRSSVNPFRFRMREKAHQPGFQYKLPGFEAPPAGQAGQPGPPAQDGRR
jgi:hypothetical protein